MSSVELVGNEQLINATSNNQPISTTGSTSTLKRTQEDSGLDSGIPAKRATMNGMEGSLVQLGGPYMGQSETITELYPVPENTVGLVIGRGGSEIQSIQTQSGCRVQMSPDADNSGFRQVTLQGMKPNIDKAKLLINDVVTRAQQRQQANQEMFKNENGNITIDVPIPATKCGLIIGKQGETIRLLQEQSGCKMQMIQDTQEVTGLAKPLRICGEPDKLEYAKKLVAELLSKEVDPGINRINVQHENINATAKGEVVVPRTSVGMIIGKGGETIKRLANETGTKIQFKPDDDPTSPERCAVIMGTRDQIYKATELITELVNKSNIQGNQTQEVFYMHIPANKTGLVIGKGGETIKQINGESGAHCELSRDPPPNPQEKVFIIRGTQHQIHHAQHIIRIKVGDIPPNTPVPMIGGGGGGGVQIHQIGNGGSFPPSNQFNNGQYGAQPVQQWGPFGGGTGVPQQGGNSQDNSVWNQNQYFAQNNVQQQQQQQPAPFTGGAMHAAAQLGQPQPFGQPGQAQAQAQGAQATPQGVQGTGQPAINPATGQPDYSAQWAEYYRSVGLLSQAAMVESQMKQNAAARAAGGAPGQAGPAAAYSAQYQATGVSAANVVGQAQQQQGGNAQFAQYQAAVVGGFPPTGQFQAQVPAQQF